ncbi:hypothetical protein Vafri_9032 [Volvox africanus]|uniref:Uncharacterized protein n=1 Tax=Volvox africanus TaxID=51714 RepID=A0A8J4B528_9CHLO|nr:hypothetical protein Vafri_9032 [Volvox africanus]
MKALHNAAIATQSSFTWSGLVKASVRLERARMRMDDNGCGRPWNDPHPFGIPLKPKSVTATESEGIPPKRHRREAPSGCGFCVMVRVLRRRAADSLRSIGLRTARTTAAYRHGALDLLPSRRQDPVCTSVAGAVVTPITAITTSVIAPTDGGHGGAAAMRPRFTLSDDVSPCPSIQDSPRTWAGIFTGHHGSWRMPNGFIALCDLTTISTTASWSNHQLDSYPAADSNRQAVAAAFAAGFGPGTEAHVDLRALSLAQPPTMTATDTTTAAATQTVAMTAAKSPGVTTGSSIGGSSCCSQVQETLPLRVRSADASFFWHALSSPTASMASSCLLSPTTSVVSTAAAAAATTAAVLKTPSLLPQSLSPPMSVPPQFSPPLSFPPQFDTRCKLDEWDEEGMPLLPYSLMYMGAAPEAMAQGPS